MLIANSEKMIQTIEISKNGKPYVDLSNEEEKEKEEKEEKEKEEKKEEEKDPESTNIEMIITENE
jgi:hypothetical protein